ncbi:ComEC family competence protein [Ruminiclostridium hungatei]|uniref:ComEC family competence protein n=1 Tax=Ruminiclostridium hungatei TaxID=48256 RepID=A0A1V4SJT3_RUMHU|nr:DNA internalization-related competence protein ComEC/Rec2 [Ruminiclostridium hungatei]OPX43501.1 ComEC family competence protein [Ruminiclostridium hungatei]
MLLKRPLCMFCGLFMAGILLADILKAQMFLSLAATGFMLQVILFNKLGKKAGLLFLCLLFFCGGGLLLIKSENKYLLELEEYYGKQISLEGYIDSEVETFPDRLRFVFRADRFGLSSERTGNIDAKLIVNIYGLEGSASAVYKKISYRTRLSLRAVLDRPKGAVNPGGFNYQRYLATVGVSGTINILNGRDMEVMGSEPGGMLYRLGFKIKNKVLGIVEKSLDENQAGLLAGMIIGYKDGLGENASEAFRQAGLTHIMVASGMNVAFIILPLMYLFKKIHLGNKAAGLIVIPVLLLFVFVAGFSASVVRAVIMGIIILAGKILMRETDIYTSISAAALILLFINPYTIYDIGFQLSFSATLALVLFYPGIKKAVTLRNMPGILEDTLAATLAAQIGTVPVTLYYFNSLSIISIITNLLVVPLVQIITITGFVMVFAGLVNIQLAVLIGNINNTFLSFVLFVAETSAKLPFASLMLPTPPGWLLFTYYAAVLYIFKGREKLKGKKAFRWAVKASAALSLLLLLAGTVLPKPLTITFLDVGQGDGAFIRTARGTTVLIDGGGRDAGSKSAFDIGEAVVVPYILDQGTRSIDLVIASHGHLDHTEGLEAVLRNIRVGRVVLPDTDGNGFEAIKDICLRKGIRFELCKKGDSIRLDRDTRMEVLNPLAFSEDSLSQQSLNNSSLMLKLIYKNIKVLFTGDSEMPVEERLLDAGTEVAADLLKVGHHGSVTSSGEPFIDRVSPRYAVVSAGEHNKFGHPSQFVLDRFEQRDIKLYRTDECGAVTAKSYGVDIKISTMLP